MLFSEPKWASGCFALFLVIGGLLLLESALGHLRWSFSLPTPVGQVLGLLLLVALARFILNQIFD